MSLTNKYRPNSIMSRVMRDGFIHGKTGQVVVPDSTGQAKQLFHNILKTNRNQQSQRQRLGSKDKMAAEGFQAPGHWGR